ncbi:kinase-like domain-containing protein [Pisolithus orientalis]|uniref:kinase-like domain-containing protein n=1 Tax=Pisolithus orientalis TaxID=936130 RepID=UPI0022259CB6|nr:kinase-like domain-containing protein [Pisolithus orientalis]KAI6030719.1 kinase-like domain-containing protein [Pisolithus orientalis]
MCLYSIVTLWPYLILHPSLSHELLVHMSVQYAPEKLAKAALDLGVNLDTWVDRDITFRPRHGGTAVVYLGTLRPQATRVAIKCLRFYPHGDESNIDHIVREIDIWRKLQHKNIVPVFGVVTKIDFAVSIVSEWMEQGNAFDYVQNETIDPRPLLLDIARGLEYLHDYAKILHGDLRSKNVLISKDGRALLTDYGISPLIDSSFSMTAAAPIRPTVRWLSPEQIDSFGEVTREADVWAFGMTVLELFTRKPPYHDIPDTRNVIARILDGPPARPTDQSTCSRLTDEWWEICSLCWMDESSRSAISDIANKIQSVMDPVPRFGSFWSISYIVELVRRFVW